MVERPQRKIEQDLVKQFAENIQHEVYALRIRGVTLDRVVSTALGGQDRELADYLLAAGARFALIEFKADERCIVSERSKRLRLKLCEALARDSAMLDRSREIHHVAWGVYTPEESASAPLAAWRQEAMITSYPGKVGSLLGYRLLKNLPPEWNTVDFISRFLRSKVVGSNAERFKRYVQELFELAEKEAGGAFADFEGSVCVYVPIQGDVLPKVDTYRFRGLQQLVEWVLRHDRSHEKSPYQQEREPEAPSRSRDLGMR